MLSLGPRPYPVFLQCDVLNEVAEANEQNNVLDIGTLTLPTRARHWHFYR